MIQTLPELHQRYIDTKKSMIIARAKAGDTVTRAAHRLGVSREVLNHFIKDQGIPYQEIRKGRK